MSIYPTRTAAHLALAGLVVFAVGVALREATVVAWGGAIVVAIALGRAATLVSVMRIRAAGFEMLWTGSSRRIRTRVGSTVTLEAEVRNRDTLSARYDKLRVVSSPALQTRIEPPAGQVHATGSVKLKVHVRALRVGYHGLFGLALEVRGAPGLFEVPLTFANPYGLEVMPRALGRAISVPQGGRSRTLSMNGRAGKRRGDGTDLRELREHHPGDPFRRIAWKASARRGKLVVREYEREERDVVMLVLDASVEHWAGPIGSAPLDAAIDITSTLSVHHLQGGDPVGLRVVAARELARVEPDNTRQQANRIIGALMENTSVLDSDRCGWDESDLAVQVTEHLRPLDPKAVGDLRRGRLDRLAKRASSMRSHGPFARRPAPRSPSARETRLRSYASAFGLYAPARIESDRLNTAATMAATLTELAKGRKARVSIVHIIAPAPKEDTLNTLRPALRKLKSKGVIVRWTPPPVAQPMRGIVKAMIDSPPPGLPRADRTDAVLDPELLDNVERAVVARAALADRRGCRWLRRLGVKVIKAPKMPSAAFTSLDDEARIAEAEVA